MKRAILISAVLALGMTAVTLAVLAETGSGSAPTSRDRARVRFVHASPDAPELDVLFHDDTLFTGFRFGEISEYVDIAAGTYTVTLSSPGPDVPILTDYITAPFNAHHTLVAAGMLAPGPGASGFEGIVITDVITYPPPGMVRGRFVHLVPDAPVPISIFLEGQPLFESIVYGDVTPYVTVPAGSHNLEVRALGFPVTADTITVDPDRIYSFFAIGLASGPPDAEILQVMDAASPHHIWLPLIRREG